MKECSETIMQKIDDYLIIQVNKLVSLYVGRGYGSEDTMEIDELIQRSRIKLWKALEKKEIIYLYSYVRRVIHSEFIDMKRQQKQVWCLFEDSNQLEGGTDPACEFIQKIESALFLHSIAHMVLALPPRQRQSILCVLHDYIDEIVQLRDVFYVYDVDLEAVRWPTDKTEKRLLVASLSVARQKLAQKRRNASKSRLT